MFLSTIQKNGNLNKVEVADIIGPGGGFHEYDILRADNDTYLLHLQFQKGPRNVESSQHGILDTDLLEIVRHRLQSFQKGDYATRENAIALTHIEEALLWMNKRAMDRLETGKLGTTVI